MLRELAGPSQAALQSLRLPARALPAEGWLLQTLQAWAAPAKGHMQQLSMKWLLEWDLQSLMPKVFLGHAAVCSKGDHASPADALHARPAKEVGPQSGPCQLPALPDAVACEPCYACVWSGLRRWQSTVVHPCVSTCYRHTQRPPFPS